MVHTNSNNYPPNWNEITQNILHRDNHRCQVAGYPSLLRLDVHHKIARANGGTHEPNNLITLCTFHHGLDPQIGHEQILPDIRCDRFTVVRGFIRYISFRRRYVRPSLR